MSEKMNVGPSPEEIKRLQDIEDAKELENHFAMHPEQLNSPARLGETGPEIAEFEAMIASFETTHPLTELHAIVEISPELAVLFEYADELASSERENDTIAVYEKYNPAYVEVYKKKMAEMRVIAFAPEDVKKFETRRVAIKDLALIISKLNSLAGDKDYENLKLKCAPLQTAIGYIKRGSNKVSHD